ncbi:MAG: hypothetical protein U1D30_13280 [Planctomycetota bacterium]
MQLAELARRTGVAGFVITDHDTLADDTLLKEAEKRFGLEIHGGIEISTEMRGRGLHLLGYGIDSGNGPLRDACRQLQEDRRRRWHSLVRALRVMGIRLDEDRLARVHSLSTPGRLHLAREIVRARAAGSVRSAFAHYLTRMEVDAPKARIDLHLAVQLIHDAGGRAVLAHPPARLTRDDWTELVSAGIDGLETRYPGASRTHQRFLEERVKEYSLLASAGSDYHGDDPRHSLGIPSVDEATFRSLVGSRGTHEVA